ncbi:MAG: hypothetical protein JXA39_08945 [Bacteroidales bacterium]|nr:hypothetical protein [Bacteroidales bacterium]
MKLSLKTAMLICGSVSAIAFIVSLVSYINWPELFLPFALTMIGFAIAFFILRSIFNYRETFSIKERKRN